MQIPTDELLSQINNGLSESQQQRWDILTDKRQQETLTDTELQEFIALNDIAEQKNVERITALAKLAKLRQMPLTDLMDELPPPKGNPERALQLLDELDAKGL